MNKLSLVGMQLPEKYKENSDVSSEGSLSGVTSNQGAIIRVLTYRRYANITVWYFFVFSHVPRRYAELLLSKYLFFAGTT